MIVSFNYLALALFFVALMRVCLGFHLLAVPSIEEPGWPGAVCKLTWEPVDDVVCLHEICHRVFS